jgi:hypothetical protein
MPNIIKPLDGLNHPARRQTAPPSGGAVSRLAALIILGLGGLLTTSAAVREWRIHQADADLSMVEVDPEARPAIPDSPSTLPPRAAMSEALVQIRVAATQTNPDLRGRRLAAARALLASAAAGRPRWPQVGVIRSYIETAAYGARSPQAIRAYSDSFAGNAYLADAAPWRIRYGLDQWALLDATTRQHVIDQAAWYATLPRGSFETMVAIAGHPAEVAIMRERAEIARAAQMQAQQE